MAGLRLWTLTPLACGLLLLLLGQRSAFAQRGTAAPHTTAPLENVPEYSQLPAGAPSSLHAGSGAGRIDLCVDANPIQSLNCTYLRSSNGTHLPFPAPGCANGTLYSNLSSYSNISAAVTYIKSLNNSYSLVSVLLMPGMHSIHGVVELANISNVSICGFGDQYGEVAVSAGGLAAGLMMTQSNGVLLENIVFTQSGHMPIVQFVFANLTLINNCIFR